MAKDAVATMGNLLPDDVGGRDAVHIAVFSAVSDEKLISGQDVALMEQADGDVKVGSSGEWIGIVDPFLGSMVFPGSRFWVYLYPRTITGLSHRWTHPSFEGAGTTYAPPSSKLESEAWLRAWISEADCPGYEEVMGKAAQISYGTNDAWDAEYLHFNDMDAHGDIPDEFWDHVEIVLGRPVEKRPKYFSCSC